ncbi:MAG: YicC/YloC family endoribonuclease [Desulfotignum sp.]
MIKSMTAFAKAVHTQDAVTAEAVIRSYNSRHLDVAVYLPDICQGLEEEIKKIVTRYHHRGRIEIRVTVQDERAQESGFDVDDARAAAYLKALKQVTRGLGLSREPDLTDVLSAGHIIVPAAHDPNQPLVTAVVSEAVDLAARHLDQMRRAEGDHLYHDLMARIDAIEAQMDQVKELAVDIPVLYKKRLEERLARLTTGQGEIDPVRLAQEVAILADKSDVSEEIVRIASHIDQFRKTMNAEQSRGQTLNFLIQEFNREFNTIGSKAGQAALSHRVVDLKSQLEKIREQVQNIE